MTANDVPRKWQFWNCVRPFQTRILTSLILSASYNFTLCAQNTGSVFQCGIFYTQFSCTFGGTTYTWLTKRCQAKLYRPWMIRSRGLLGSVFIFERILIIGKVCPETSTLKPDPGQQLWNRLCLVWLLKHPAISFFSPVKQSCWKTDSFYTNCLHINLKNWIQLFEGIHAVFKRKI